MTKKDKKTIVTQFLAGIEKLCFHLIDLGEEDFPNPSLLIRYALLCTDMEYEKDRDANIDGRKMFEKSWIS